MSETWTYVPLFFHRILFQNIHRILFQNNVRDPNLCTTVNFCSRTFTFTEFCSRTFTEFCSRTFTGFIEFILGHHYCREQKECLIIIIYRYYKLNIYITFTSSSVAKPWLVWSGFGLIKLKLHLVLWQNKMMSYGRSKLGDRFPILETEWCIKYWCKAV